MISESKFAAAATKYTEAIELHPTAVFYSNRSLAMIKMESYGSAILDSNEALALDPSYIKAYYRWGITSPISHFLPDEEAQILLSGS
jgi:serine/threonine-protein phosphatase 5